MRPLALGLVFLSIGALPSWAEDVSACRARDAALTRQADSFTGDAKMKRLIDADLKRAKKEAAEGDAEECMEALDHAAKLLAGGA